MPKAVGFTAEFALNQEGIKTLAAIMFTKIAGDTR
jgi:hypothetical protein